jgi:hypothetical protein
MVILQPLSSAIPTILAILEDYTSVEAMIHQNGSLFVFNADPSALLY